MLLWDVLLSRIFSCTLLWLAAYLIIELRDLEECLFHIPLIRCVYLTLLISSEESEAKYCIFWHNTLRVRASMRSKSVIYFPSPSSPNNNPTILNLITERKLTSKTQRLYFYSPQKSKYRVMIENLCSSVNKTGLKSQPHCAILGAMSNLNFFVLK